MIARWISCGRRAKEAAEEALEGVNADIVTSSRVNGKVLGFNLLTT
jgi:hypothetical protein